MRTLKRNVRFVRSVAVLFICLFLTELIFPTAAMALTSGPSAPEVQSFTPIGTTDMVDLFSGDMNYNIPLLDVGGYPINLSYNAGISPDQEASWVGLGWNLNPGAINRNMRSLPDDFKGDKVTNKMNLRPNRTVGASFAVGEPELIGLPIDNSAVNASVGLNYNNYNGISYTTSVGFSAPMGENETSRFNLSLAAADGSLNVSPSVSFDSKIKANKSGTTLHGKVGLNFNSRSGLAALSLGMIAPRHQNTVGNVTRTFRQGSQMARISFVGATYVPQVNFPKNKLLTTFSAQVGAGFFAADASGTISAYYAQENLRENELQVPSYGHHYFWAGTEETDQHDFTRENDGAFDPRMTKYLPLSNHTYDLFTIQGQGIGGQFRSQKNTVGHIYDVEATSVSVDVNFPTIELNGGNLFDAGFDFEVNPTTSKSGLWSEDNSMIQLLKNDYTYSDETDYERTYFKMVGELNVDPEITGANGVYEHLGKNQPVRNKIAQDGSLTSTLKFNNNTQNNNINTQSDISRTAGRNPRNQSVSYLTKKEVADGASIFRNNAFTDPDAKDHHIGEITVLRNDGARYIYGHPAYITEHIEMTFNASGLNVDPSSDLVTYSSTDASVNNQNGQDHFFQSSEIPPYAHSFHLSAIVSPDYVDRSLDGPSSDDFGTYTVFEYGTVSDYRWRTPYDRASLSEGMKSRGDEDKANVVTGTKDLLYLENIKTKTHVAVFVTSNRTDGLSAAAEPAGANAQGNIAMKRLDEIKLFTVEEYNANGANGTPIQTVHFQYDYSLCPNIPNSSSSEGKLTLTHVYFTYGNSNKAKFSPYNFEYAASQDPGYAYKNYDVWGNYKSNSGAVGNDEFPYVDQNDANLDDEAAMWSLNAINLPSGGRIEVDYEVDDYAFVQDRKAMQMYKVAGFSETSSSSISNQLYSGSLGGTEHKWIHIDFVQQNGDFQSRWSEMYQDLLDQPIYFRSFMNVGGPNSEEAFEWVEGYCYICSEETSPTPTLVSGDNYRGALKLERVSIKGIGDGSENVCSQDIAMAHPWSMAGWNYARTYLPKVALGLPDNDAYDDEADFSLQNVLDFLSSGYVGSQIENMIHGPYRDMRSRKLSREVDLDRSWVRLNNVGGRKKGGGLRVKEIRLVDNWSNMTSQEKSMIYGQRYEYVLEDGTTSSGVASFEPFMSKENPFVEPIFMHKEIALVPDESAFIEGPIGKSLYPSAQVGYSRVVTTPVTYEPWTDGAYIPIEVNDHGTGYSVDEFYTAKDFPTISRATDLGMIEKKGQVMQALNFISRNEVTASQGFIVEVNDMHGKPRSSKQFSTISDQAISGTTYVYNLTEASVNVDGTPEELNGDADAWSEVNFSTLDNVVTVINADGTTEEREIGVEMDVSVDFRESKTEVSSYGVEANVGSFWAAIFPAIIPTAYPTYRYNRQQFRSATITKMVSRQGILRSTVVEEDGVYVTTKNLAYDAITGEVLLTETVDEYGDNIYNFSYPSHWAYSGMEPAYNNIGYTWSQLQVTNGSVESNALSYLESGDEIWMSFPDEDNETDRLVWFWDGSDGTNDPATQGLIDESGQWINVTNASNVFFKVIRSGKRNQQAVPIGSVVCKTNPLPVGTGTIAFSYDGVNPDNPQIVQASVNEFDQKWRTYGQFDLGAIGVCEETALGTELMDFLNAYVDNELASATVGQAVPYDFNSLTWLSNFQNMFNYPGYLSSCGAINVDIQDLVLWVKITASNDLLMWFVEQGKPFNETQPDLHFRFFMSSDLTNIVDVQLGVAWDENTELGYYSFLTATDQNDQVYFGEVIRGDCWPEGELVDCPPPSLSCSPSVGDIVNPYQLGLRGNWRSKRGRVYYGDRDAYDQFSDVTYTPEDGLFSLFDDFWTYNGSSWVKDNNADSKWTWTSEISNYDPLGGEVENYNPLHIYSSAVYGYAGTLPLLVSNNADYQDVAFDGFEDYNYTPGTSDCGLPHFRFDDFYSNLTQEESHSGRYSIKVIAQESASATRLLISSPVEGLSHDDWPYTFKNRDVLGTFGPRMYDRGEFIANETLVSEDRRFVFSYWVHEEDFNSDVDFTFNSHSPFINVAGTNILDFSTLKVSPIIDGWQQRTVEFTIPASSSGEIVIGFTGDVVDNTVTYFDDIRILPFNASLKSFVYDPMTLRLMAELDENNFATFYEYDLEGRLLRVKKETERGIMTIQESRNSSPKSNLTP
ncbi:MAG: hypothetical protein MK081_14715 [Flavobacteriales bacterium]|nr:hypothetical protein [Flavobacteriales bacterium]